MATIYTMDGYYAAEGLQGSDVCDEAIQIARSIAKERGETVRLEDDDGHWDVDPDGSVSEADPWPSDEESDDYPDAVAIEALRRAREDR